MRRSPTPYLVLIVSLLLTAAAAGAVRDSSRQRDRARFDNAVQSTSDRIQGRLDTYVALLRGTAGLLVASDRVDRAGFRRFVERLNIEAQYPGIQGIGFTRRLDPEEVALLEAQVRADGIGEFRVWPRDPRPEYHTILFLEPLDRRNRAALGYDMFTEPVRREAMAAARDSGRARLTGKVTLVQEIQGRVQAGFLVYLPVYAGGVFEPDVAGRRTRLEGFVFAPFRADDLFAGIFGTEREPRVSFQVYDGPRVDPAHLLHASHEPGTDESPVFRDTVQMQVQGRTWTLAFASRPALERGSGMIFLPGIIGAGVLVSLVLFGLTRAQALARESAEAGAEGLRASLDERERLAVRERAARAHAEAANRAKSRFLAVMSHELRTPLNAIGGYAELLEMGIQGPVTGGQQEYLNRIRASQQHLTSLINDILDFARLEEGALEYRLSDVRVSAVVAEVEAMLAPQAQTRGLTLARDPGERGATVYADAERLRQILVNLAGNAVKFTPSGGRVVIRWRTEDRWVRVQVRDNGVGIPPERLPRIFEPFVQVENELTRTEGGVGLGLAISRELARNMGGDLTVESEPGVGSTFTLTLPSRAGVAAEEDDGPGRGEAHGAAQEA